jgi:phosphate transport system substrate-binding protein
MKKALHFRSYLSFVVLMIFLAIFLTACSGGSSGSIVAAGSSALQPLVDEAAKQFMAKNPDSRITVQGGGSGTGLTQVFQGAVNIGDSDIYAEELLKEDEAKQLTDNIVCVVGIAAVVNPNVKVDNITKKQLIDIFTGKIANWKEVGGDDKKIILISRPAGSGTKATFKKYALDGAEEVEGVTLTQDQSGTVRKTVADTEGSIAYLALSYLNSTIKALKLDGVEANSENIANGKYPVWAYEHMYTKGEATGLTKAFIDYILSEEVQKSIVPKLKFIPIKEMKTKH